MINLIIYVLGIITVVMIVSVISLASFYDIWLTRRKQLFQAHPGTRRFRHRPLVSIIISGKDIALVKQTLDSVMRSTYRKREIIISDLERADQKQLQHYRSVRFAKNQKVGESGRGELVLKIRGGMTIDSKTPAQAVWHFNDQPNTMAVICAATPRFYPSQSHLFATYQSLLSALLHKAESIFGHVNPDVSNVMIQKREFTATATPKRIVYVDDATFAHLPVTNFLMLLKLQHNKKQGSLVWRLYMSLLFLASTYIIYIAVWLHQPALLMLALLALALLLLAAIWWNTHLSWLHKCTYAVLLPISIGYFYLLSAMQLLEMIADVTKAIVPLSVSLFMRVKNILRVVE